MDGSMIWEWIIKSIIIILALTVGFAYVTLYERKALAFMQVRVGPNRVGGRLGLLQPVADAFKLIFKEEMIPGSVNKFLYLIAPVLTVVPALIVTAVVPWGSEINLFGRPVKLYLADVNVGVLYLIAVSSLAIYGIALGGWSSNNKYSTLGSLRGIAQMVSYEIGLGFAMVAPVMMAGSMSLVDIVNGQRSMWYAVLQPVAFVIYFIAALAEINRHPFDLPEAEQELTAGYLTEYGGMKFALFFMAEYIKMITIAMIGATLFLGGYLGPFVDQVPILGPVYLFIKVMIILFVIIWVRASLPRFRYDRLMQFGWKVLFPVALANVFITALVQVLAGG